jgi:hypothetical protein
MSNLPQFCRIIVNHLRTELVSVTNHDELLEEFNIDIPTDAKSASGQVSLN